MLQVKDRTIVVDRRDGTPVFSGIINQINGVAASVTGMYLVGEDAAERTIDVPMSHCVTIH